ncbi:MAG: mechanosensitive ion channel family protein, partial [Elainellaceae cyanobacterium]
LLMLLAVAVYLAILPNFFPQTEGIGRRLLAYVLSVVGNFWGGVLSYLPKLLAIALVITAANFILRFLRLFFTALEEEQLTIPGFYQEWIQPTYKLTQTLVVLLGLTFVLPYLPGFGSPAFQGISLLFGALLTLGGASTVSNLIGGFITIYTRAFQIGDRIQINDYVGYVMEKTILSTRIRTANNELVTSPNSSLVASTIVNYTATLRDIKEPLVMHVDLTLGYDLPWRKVHTVLVAAARATPHILQEPAPVVRQMALSDFYIEYELRACTQEVECLNAVYSELYQNILDHCRDNEIEILSPHYSNERSIE